ncbi:hypothetical protein BAX51_03455 [Mycoplasmoides gallisepticum]|uniref:DUF3196 domain-containing protein n=4 Tax=Mycoplasmoides gallisepticum TaxID=2096 RepID=Q7NBA7_MYCGA|nr:DUF3196 family protein [Mycoplasmoides gallisepticum]AAP56722.2 conserved hypothetical protein [Mycoplasmoides gallisepticum str. R(low)]ADC30575.1 conserved hypothetical protein [Mycoplasmoides gallisepticum str. R(high)]OBU78793.1 hypothetical protein BAY36_02005 [Mycoplasmoides gallisepticum]OBU79439.1 hypothetical protein BAY37_00805 [Mycoplasmoides gallisepticum]OBU79625.1 hypothetical protein BAX53_03550 [Mycoplasmoides gallisepticum]
MWLVGIMKKWSNLIKTMMTKNKTFHTINEIINDLSNSELANDQNTQFYLSLLMMIKTDLDNKDFKKALTSIQEELDTDYLPLALIDYFKQAHLVTKRLMYENEFDWLEKLDKKELINKTIINFPENLWYFDYLATKEENFWNIDDFEFFRHIFITKTYDNSDKLVAAQLLQKIEPFINLSFEVYNNKLKQTFTVTLKKDDIWAKNTQAYFNDVLDQIESSFYKDPSKEQLATEIVNNIMQDYYPSYPDFVSVKELASGIIQYVKNCFDNKKPNTKINSIVYDVIINCIDQ